MSDSAPRGQTPFWKNNSFPSLISSSLVIDKGTSIKRVPPPFEYRTLTYLFFFLLYCISPKDIRLVLLIFFFLQLIL